MCALVRIVYSLRCIVGSGLCACDVCNVRPYEAVRMDLRYLTPDSLMRYRDGLYVVQRYVTRARLIVHSISDGLAKAE
ncbi:hypothetical protein CC85DRAFT_18047 [Cutaneotrichosporon oleaginosum]|uniref:Uncharacterized protein n=1 Tax=Cutaneotrichosporon oleaginosum TaxID=879819 RepID=A0A0J0XTM7_9TREE|nr:uncharacterized protein CC85DRAFT_18047 [Cutaneotrichosporon oleaginosum]KLT44436.1 hypothetical protein CC85DRAFT_18047 [Cutaneotrichosporon oleaginosum]TXT07844.1 hypothetical protein COLE_04768 [Cutaneotrichosporon oleaginosum]